ncbi:ABC transporter substrate-binding protein [Microbacterium trichothecenolyticum]|uniref:ABC transporter substrate-binding protein n=1 Tax=Microbacterium trichothecenolyticum TaxID=69370 RepID=UPI0035BEA168
MTAEPGFLRVGSAFPDPPFNGSAARPEGLDVALLTALAEDLGRRAAFVPFEGDDFDDIFSGLGREYDCIASGTTITAARQKLGDFGPPYLVSGQALAVNTTRHPDIHDPGDLTGMTIGVQAGNTSEPIARAWAASGLIAGVKVYPYHRIHDALHDVSAGSCDAVMKLHPVLRNLVADIDDVEVVMHGLSVEQIAIATAVGDPLGATLAQAQAARESEGSLPMMRRTWLGAGDRNQP